MSKQYFIKKAKKSWEAFSVMSLNGPLTSPHSKANANARLPPEVNRIIYVRNLPFKISAEEMYDIFGKFGAIRQIRRGSTAATRGRAYVVYEDIYEAKNAVDHLSGFNVGGRYIIVLYHNTKGIEGDKTGKIDLGKKQKELERLKEKYGVTAEATPIRPQ
eukprot:gb/GEZN01024527.1/.p1 GENE.gb/GEZN01024527.1/~~gb/GEZN01024527.1/.p1  ORF type:complete len:160 (+),score=19.57 gb/GEZN01024527.1/:49-528(+)